ncbi:MAG: hypothetical protein M3354_01075 [Chloroflexota bacterium]|nr:hypothetical protein [Chloroflexota bacterium]
MPHDNDHAIVVVSDFHLAAGYDRRTGRFDRHETFFHDDAFARFLDDLRRRAIREDRRWRLVILGDLLDFLRVPVGSPGKFIARPDTSDRATLDKLNRIVASHPEFFEALGRFVAAGFWLDIVPGNHDIELISRPVQERFKEQIVRAGGGSEALARITFHPWIYYQPGVLYAEHGQQYHDINAFPTLLRPCSPRHPDEIDLPLGSHIESYLGNLAEAIDPFGTDPMAPATLLRAVRKRPSLVLQTLPHHARLVRTILGDLRDRSRPGNVAERAAYREEVVRRHADELGLPPDTLVAIDRLSMVSAGSMTSRLARKLTVNPVRRFRVRSRVAIGSPSYLFQAALVIHQLLQAAGKAVPFYVFGHAHRADQLPLAVDASTPSYLNSGSWTGADRALLPSPGGRHFTFIEISRKPNTLEPVARLLRWNDFARRHELLPLSET